MAQASTNILPTQLQSIAPPLLTCKFVALHPVCKAAEYSKWVAEPVTGSDIQQAKARAGGRHLETLSCLQGVLGL